VACELPEGSSACSETRGACPPCELVRVEARPSVIPSFTNVKKERLLGGGAGGTHGECPDADELVLAGRQRIGRHVGVSLKAMPTSMALPAAGATPRTSQAPRERGLTMLLTNQLRRSKVSAPGGRWPSRPAAQSAPFAQPNSAAPDSALGKQPDARPDAQRRTCGNAPCRTHGR
jgi:hypothetical protein